MKKLRPLLDREQNSGERSGQCAKTRESPRPPDGAAEGRKQPDDLETSKVNQYNHFDADRRSRPPCAAEGRCSRRVRELASSLTRNQPVSEESPGNSGISAIGAVIGVGGQDSPQPAADPELLFVAEKWASLPAAIRAGVVAMINGLVPGASVESPDALPLNKRRSLKA